MWPRCNWVESYGRDNAGVGEGGGGSNDGVCNVVVDCLVNTVSAFILMNSLRIFEVAALPSN